MSTTHKAAPYAREYNTDHTRVSFHFSDYHIGWSLGLEIAEALGERLTDAIADDTRLDIGDIVHDVSVEALPIYYSDILKEWQEAGCPDPEDAGTVATLIDDRAAIIYDNGSPIWELMSRALYETISNFAFGLTNYTDSLSEALERLNTIYPYKND